MKRIIILMIITAIASNSWCVFERFNENPAQIGGRQFGDIVLPGFAMTGGIRNSTLSISDFSMFEKDHVLTDGEKSTLTASNFNLTGFGKFTLLRFGYKNWEFSMDSHIKGNLGDIGKNYLKLVFYGNSLDSYHEQALSETYGYQFMKGKFTWTNPEGYNMSFIPIFDFATKESPEFVYYLQDGMNFIREMKLYIGANVNLYNANGYGEVLRSNQAFITSPDSAYYAVDFKYVHTDTSDITINTGINLGFGLGMKLELPKGWIHFGLDDLGAELEYDNLQVDSYSKEFTDYLDLLDDDHEAIEEENDLDVMAYDGSRKVKLDPTVVFGVEHEIGWGFSVMGKYLKCDYMLDGYFLGIDYRLATWMPLNFTLSSGDVNSYRMGFGFDTKEFQMVFGVTQYDGMFNASKGLGSDFGIRFKF